MLNFYVMAKKILAVDDEPLILTSIERALTKIGYEVRTAKNREEFMETLDSDGFDLVILDVHMDDISREEVISISKGRFTDIKFLIISGSQFESDVDFIQKPFRISELRNKVRELLNERS